MKDAAPRIFRSLERQFGLGEFDTVVAAAVATFGSLRNPSATQVEDLSRLVVPLWGRTRDETKRNVAASLSHAKRVPRSLVELLMESPVEVAAPFLVSSPALNDADLAALASSPDERIAKLVRNRDARGAQPPAALPLAPAEQAARAEAPVPAATLASAPEAVAAAVQSAPEPQTEPQPDPEPMIEAPSLAADFLSQTPFNARAPSPGRRMPPRNADEARELLRRLATAGRGQPRREAPGLPDLMNAAFAREDVLFYETLSDIFLFDPDTLSRLIDEPSGETLAVALRALKANSADALSILMLMKPSVGLDVATFDSMARFYNALKPEDCRAVIAASGTRYQPLTSPETYRQGEPARRDFGRRSERPLGREAKG
ncbi:hypothetical protein [Aureimonas sp. AU20]|uniref:hypothetical protein n=1 Tax=Aureimonas sp. AU20 TaxID=1349819 RepID=UPI00071F3BA3|nr:hypothetical protein [Aureimonas sp. AU20]ALN73982.1 hypothetical protein M673_14740 [Aureimonas sp. AU20]